MIETTETQWTLGLEIRTGAGEVQSRELACLVPAGQSGQCPGSRPHLGRGQSVADQPPTARGGIAGCPTRGGLPPLRALPEASAPEGLSPPPAANPLWHHRFSRASV